LNAIEPLWKDLKRAISPTIFEGKDHFQKFVTETFLRLSKRYSFAIDWIETFLPGRIYTVSIQLSRRLRTSHSTVGTVLSTITTVE
jgi:hypothetical protein